MKINFCREGGIQANQHINVCRVKADLKVLSDSLKKLKAELKLVAQSRYEEKSRAIDDYDKLSSEYRDLLTFRSWLKGKSGLNLSHDKATALVHHYYESPLERLARQAE